MGERTTIAWCHHTFNSWVGCHKVSPACKNCYAAVHTFPRVQRGLGRELWGANAERHFFGDKHWREPLKWSREAAAAGERRRVFCGSMMDVFELHDSATVLGMQDEARARLWGLIADTPHLDWLLLTKRPENAGKCLPLSWWMTGCPSNVWVGATVENQEYAEARIPWLLKVRARVRFLSCEPLLGQVDLLLRYATCDACGGEFNTSAERCPSCGDRHKLAHGRRGIHWVIAGGESGHHAREHQLDWSRSLRDQCAAAGVPFFFKQTGEHATDVARMGNEAMRMRLALAPRSKGESLGEIPLDLRIRELPPRGMKELE